MKEQWNALLQKLQGKHADCQRSAKRLGAFAVAMALVTTLVSSPLQGVAYAVTGADSLASGYEDTLEDTTTQDPRDETFGGFEPNLDASFSVDPAGINMKDLITSSTLQWRDPEKTGDDWHTFGDGTSLEYRYELQVVLNYTVPIGKLWETGVDDTYYDTLWYVLPTALTDFSSSGIVYEGVYAVGNYWIEAGLVTIQFTQDYVTSNQNSALKGVLSFYGKVSDLQIGDDGNVDLGFNTKVDHVFTVKPEPADLTVKKYTVKKDVAGNEIRYRVEISTEKGTGYSNVILHDELSIANQNGKVEIGAVYDKRDLITQVVKIDSDNQETYLKSEMDSSPGDEYWELKNFQNNGKQGSSFDLVLPPLKAGEKYNVYYKCKINDSDKLKGDFTVNNVATASAGETTTPVVGTMKTSNTVSGLIAKKGDKNAADHTITWTVELNNNQADLGGFWLRDFMYDSVAQKNSAKGTELVGTKVTINRKKAGESTFTYWKEATLPYEFEQGDNYIYQFVYTTPDDPAYGNNNSPINRAYLANSGTDPETTNWPYSTSDKVGTTRDDRYFKEGLGVEENEDGRHLTLKWKLTLNPVRDQTGWKLYDTLADGQYFTDTQLKDLESALAKALKDYGYNGVTYNKNSSGQVIGINVVAKADGVWPANHKVEIEYESTFDRDTTTIKNYTFENKATFEYYNFSAYNYYHEGSVVQKVDVSSGNVETGAVTSHGRYDLKEEDQLKWDIIVTLTEKMKAEDNFTIIETMPSGVKLTGMTLKAGDYFDRDVKLVGENNSWTATVNGAEVTATRVGTTFTIVVPKRVYSNTALKNKTITLEVTADLVGADRWAHDVTYSFQNKVTVKSDALPEGGSSASQTQQIYYNADSDAIQKSAEKPDGTQNLVQYTLDVNPHARSYAGGASRLELVDTMTSPEDVQLFLEAEGTYGVHVYEYTDENTTLELNSSEYSYLYEEKGGKSILTFQIPNQKHLKVQYTYRVSGSVGVEYALNNTALLRGTSSTGTSSGNDFSLRVQSISASISRTGIVLYKVDSQNDGKRLEGAEFKLEKWVMNSTLGQWEWQTVQDKVVSDKTGKLQIYNINNNTPLVSGVAFRLTETKAPRGYELAEKPFDFYLDTLPETVQKSLPSDYDGQLCLTSQSVFVRDVAGYYDPKVDKVIVEGQDTSKENTVRPGTVVQFQTTIQAAHSTPLDYVLHDKMDDFDFDADSLKIVDADGTELVKDRDYTLVTPENSSDGCADGCAFEVQFAEGVIARGGRYTVTYSAALREDEDGSFPNDTWLTYTEDGKAEETEHSETTTRTPTYPTVPIVPNPPKEPDPEPTPDPDPNPTPDPDPEPTPDPDPDPEPTPDPDPDPDPTPDPDPDPEPTPDPDPDPDPTPDPDPDPEPTPDPDPDPDPTPDPDPDPEPTPDPDPDPEPTPDPDPDPTPDPVVPVVPVVPVEPVIPTIPVTPIDPSDVTEPEQPADSEAPADSEQPAESQPEDTASSDSTDQTEQPVSPDDTTTPKPGAPGADNQDGWVLGAHGEQEAGSDSTKPGTPGADNQKNWVLGAHGLIQTGQLNWPIPLLIGLGGALVFVGIHLRRKSKKHQDE